MNTVGPSRVRFMGGKWYVLVIVDDYSCYSWVFFLESKDKVFEHIQSLALRLNNEHPNCLKGIRSDNGTEFRIASFDQFCLEHSKVFCPACSSLEWSHGTKKPHSS
jgi:IS30 family transposase